MRIGIDEGKGLHSTSPKQPSTRRRRDWYPYYAGYTQSFVDAVIGECLEEPTFVIDPWSGSGTTTVTCLKRGVASKGVDINPALTVIARARLTPMGCRAKIEKALEESDQVCSDEQPRCPAIRPVGDVDEPFGGDENSRSSDGDPQGAGAGQRNC